MECWGLRGKYVNQFNTFLLCVCVCVLIIAFFPRRATGWVLHRDLVVHYLFICGFWAGEHVCVSPVPLLRDSRGSSLGLSGLLGHSFVIMTFDLCRPVCREECRRCLPSLRLMVSRWLFLSPFFFHNFFFQSCVFFLSQAS